MWKRKLMKDACRYVFMTYCFVASVLSGCMHGWVLIGLMGLFLQFILNEWIRF
jgi:hypothetical protein